MWKPEKRFYEFDLPAPIHKLVLLQFNQGASASQRYVTSRPMFMNLEVMNKDLRTVLGPEGGYLDVSDIMNGLSSVYKDILGKPQPSVPTGS